MKHLKYMVVVLLLNAWFSGSVYAADARKFLWNKAYFYNFYSVSPLASGDVWAVGSNGMVCRLNPETYEWNIQEPGLHGNLYSVSFVDDSHGWVCGTILYTEDGEKPGKGKGQNGF